MPDTKVGITEVVLRDGHQSLLATRLTLADMLPIAKELDQVGYWSIESWEEASAAAAASAAGARTAAGAAPGRAARPTSRPTRS